jgi:hypothetical protein
MSKRVKPHQVRGRELEEVREKDPDGRIVMVGRPIHGATRVQTSMISLLHGQMSITTSRSGREQQVSRLPSAGRSSGSGS